MNQCGHIRDSQDVHHQLVEDETENPPTAGFPSFDDPAYCMKQVPYGNNIIPAPSHQPTDDGASISPVMALRR